MKMVALVFLSCMLAGFCACGLGAEETSIQSTTIETTTEQTEPEEFEYAVTQRIHESLSEFRFTVYGHHEDRWNIIEVLEISGENFFQRMDGFSAKHHPELSGIVLKDFNNDGYLDIQLYLDNSGKHQPSKFWLWDNEKHEFVENVELHEISLSVASVDVDDDGRLCVGSYGAGGSWANYFLYINGELVLVEEHWETFRFTEDDECYVTKEIYQLIDGEMKLISTKEEKLEEP